MKTRLFCLAALLLLTACRGPAPLADAGQSADEPAGAATALMDLLLVETDETVTAFFQEDFDGDGTEEAFAYTEGRGRTLWFVSAEGARVLHQNLGALETSVVSPCSGVGSGRRSPPLFLLAEWYSHATRTTSLLFGVKNGAPYQVEGITGLMAVSQDADDPARFTALESKYDGSPEGMGHTYKPYWFYWDEESGAFREYGGIALSLDSFQRLAGADGVLETILERDGMVCGILARGNRVLNVNYQTSGNRDAAGSSQIWNHYMTLTLSEDGSLALAEEGDGVYQAALTPELAVYPVFPPQPNGN